VQNLLEGVAGALPEKAVQYLRRIHANTDRLVRLTSMLLDLTRLDAGHLPLEPEAVRLPEVLADLLQEFESAADKTGILLRADELTDVPVRADRRQLEQILHNLMHNAIKYTPERGSVTVRSDPMTGRWRSPSQIPDVAFRPITRKKSFGGSTGPRRPSARGAVSASPLRSSW
jgi:signal transduction histidine kinase